MLSLANCLECLANGEVEARVGTEGVVEAQVHAVAADEVKACAHAAGRVDAAEAVVIQIVAYLAGAEVGMIEYDTSLKKRLWGGLQRMFLN